MAQQKQKKQNKVIKEVDFDRLANQVSDFLNRHKSSMYEIATHGTNVFEAFCFIIVVRHYEMAGYELKPENLLDGKFRFKYNTRGYPWNYSYFVVSLKETEEGNDNVLFEIRHNLKVSGAWVRAETDNDTDPPMFALDVAVIESNSLPVLKMGQKRNGEKYWVDNTHLITFGEAKKLTAYPMLLAQFLGIVHEIKPEFLNIEERERLKTILDQKHPPPLLLTSNHLTWGTKQVLKSFQDRDLLIRVVEDVTGSSEQVLLNKMKGDESQETDEAEIPF